MFQQLCVIYKQLFVSYSVCKCKLYPREPKWGFLTNLQAYYYDTCARSYHNKLYTSSMLPLCLCSKSKCLDQRSFLPKAGQCWCHTELIVLFNILAHYSNCWFQAPNSINSHDQGFPFEEVLLIHGTCEIEQTMLSATWTQGYSPRVHKPCSAPHLPQSLLVGSGSALQKQKHKEDWGDLQVQAFQGVFEWPWLSTGTPPPLFNVGQCSRSTYLALWSFSGS